MAYYSYKRMRDILIDAGWIDKYGNPVDKDKYGEFLETGYDGNMWDIAADYFESLPIIEPTK
jgi:hypothetical protein